MVRQIFIILVTQLWHFIMAALGHKYLYPKFHRILRNTVLEMQGLQEWRRKEVCLRIAGYDQSFKDKV